MFVLFAKNRVDHIGFLEIAWDDETTLAMLLVCVGREGMVLVCDRSRRQRVEVTDIHRRAIAAAIIDRYARSPLTVTETFAWACSDDGGRAFAGRQALRREVERP